MLVLYYEFEIKDDNSIYIIGATKMTNDLLGIHHVTAITSSAEKNYQFYSGILGMRLVKKTVNQDDIHTYHTFFADDEGNAGTDLTFLISQVFQVVIMVQIQFLVLVCEYRMMKL